MRRPLIAAALAVLGAWSDQGQPVRTTNASNKQDFQLSERGRYLTVVADCAACHSVPGSDQKFAGGRAIETPLGSVLAANITPDRETGIGAWPDDEFVAALLQGTGRSGKHLYPVMPYTYFTRMT